MRRRDARRCCCRWSPKHFSPSQTWGKQTSFFCWCQHCVWHTTACLRKQHWKDHCVIRYLGLSDRAAGVVVRSCLVMMHRLCAAVCCQSTSIREGKNATAWSSMLQHRVGGWCSNVQRRAGIQYHHSSSFSRIIMPSWNDIVTLWCTSLLSEVMITSKLSHFLFWRHKIWKMCLEIA